MKTTVSIMINHFWTLEQQQWLRCDSYSSLSLWLRPSAWSSALPFIMTTFVQIRTLWLATPIGVMASTTVHMVMMKIVTRPNAVRTSMPIVARTLANVSHRMRFATDTVIAQTVKTNHTTNAIARSQTPLIKLPRTTWTRYRRDNRATLCNFALNVKWYEMRRTSPFIRAKGENIVDMFCSNSKVWLMQ